MEVLENVYAWLALARIEGKWNLCLSVNNYTGLVFLYRLKLSISSGRVILAVELVMYCAVIYIKSL